MLSHCSYLLHERIFFSLTDQEYIFLLKLFPFLCPTESVYDLLPKELQLPPSRETSVASMSQTSGGEAGSPPPAVVAAGKHSHLFCCFVKVCNILANMNSAGKVLVVKGLWRVL